MVRACRITGIHARRMLKKSVQQGRSKRRAEAYPLGYVEGLNDARTKLAGFSAFCYSTAKARGSIILLIET